MSLDMPNSLADPTKGPSGKRKVIAVRDVLVAERKRLLGIVEGQAKEAVNTFTQVVRESRFADTTAAKPEFWEGLVDAGNTMNALTGQIHAYDQCIELLDRILKDTPTERSSSGRKDQGKAEEGQAQEAGSEGAASAEREGGDDKSVSPAVRKRGTGTRTGGKRGASGQARGRTRRPSADR